MGSSGVRGLDDSAGWLAGTLSGVAFRARRTPKLLLSHWCVDALPSEESSVDGPPTRSQHRQRCSDGSG